MSLPKKPARKELQIFSDAFENAIANVVFLRTMFSDNSVSLNSILGKARGAPIKRMTTPNLELLANSSIHQRRGVFCLPIQPYIGLTALLFSLVSIHRRAGTNIS